MFLPISILSDAREIAAANTANAKFGLDFSEGGIYLVVTTLSDANLDGTVSEGDVVEIGRKLLDAESLRDGKKIWIPREKLSSISVNLKSDRNQEDEKNDRASSGDRGVSSGVIDQRDNEQPVRLGGRGDQQSGVDGIDQSVDVIGGSNEVTPESVSPREERPANDRNGVSTPSQEDGVALAVAGSMLLEPSSDISAQFELTEEILAENRGPKQKARDNVAALKLLKELEGSTDDRTLTIDEKITLARYVGWGGLPDAFRTITGDVKDTWGDIVADIESILSEKEIKSARRSTLDAHYTSKDVVDIIYAGVKATGIQPRKISEPSVGTGNFIGLSPFDHSLFTAVELDGVTAAITGRIYPEAKVIHSGFQDTERGEGSFYDLVVGNPPFGSNRIIDQSNERLTNDSPNTHTYFFNKSMSRLAPGGVLAMVVSRYLMDADASQPFRERMARQSDLVAAIRLPGNAFMQNAGTSVVTDIIFLQKRHEPLSEEDDLPAWVQSVNVLLPVDKKPGEFLEARINEYYANRRDQIMGNAVLGRGMYRDNEFMVLPTENWKERAMAFVSGIKHRFDLPDTSVPLDQITERQVDKSIPLHYGKEPEGTYILVPNENNNINGLGDVILGCRVGPVAEDGLSPYVPVTAPVDENDVDETLTFDLKKSSADRIRAYIPIRDSMSRLIDLQVSPYSGEAEIEAERVVMGKVYDDFVKQFGLLNRQFNANAIKNDPHAYRVMTLERDYQKAVSPAMSAKTGEPVRPESAKKAPIFVTRTQFPPAQEPTSADTAEEALLVSMNFKGRINTAYIQSLLGGREWAEIRQELGERILLTDKGWEMSGAVIQGDVITRIDDIMNSGIGDTYPDEFSLTVDALRKAMPERKTVENGEVVALQGSQWIPLDITRQFINESFGNNAVDIIPIVETGTWDVKSGKGINSGEFTTERVSSVQMARYLLHRHAPEVFDTVTDSNGDEHRVLNEGQTELARSKMDALLERWDKWIVGDPERVSLIEDAFNSRFNRFAPYTPFGNHLTFPGKSNRIDLRPTQKDGVWRMLQQQATLLDHAVGAGKTFTATAGAMEMKRIGLTNKAMITMPNGLEGQWAEAISDLYPSANVIVPSKKDMSAKNRQAFLARIAVDNEIDIVLMPHSSFSLIPRDPAFEEKFINNQIDQLRSALASAAMFASENGKSGKSHSTKAIEKKIANREAKLKKILMKSASGDAGIHFGQLGIDLLVVDESQQFKNVSYQTTLTGVGGLGSPDGSAKADDCMIKTRSIIESGGRVVDMSGTPEANTLAEVYLSQYKMDHKSLEKMGIYSFDQWASVFARVSYEFQPTLSGGYKERAYLNEFVNLSILRASLSYRHSVTIEDVQRLAIEAGMPPMELPELEGGKPQVVVCPKTKLQESLIGYQVGIDPMTGDPQYNVGSILHQIDNLPAGRPKKGEKNILTCIGDLNKVGLSANAYLSDDPDIDERSPKLDSAANEIMVDYHRWSEDKGTQVVFLDFSTPKPDKKGKQSEESIEVRGWLKDIEAGERDDATDEMLSRRDAAEESLSGYTQSEIEDLLSDGKEWSAYSSLKSILVEKGMKPDEIAFVHDYENPVKREELFGKVRSGQVRVIMGSTSKMGAGVNIQERMVAMHMLDAPWRPDQMIQRIGRMLRQGNLLLKKYGKEFTVRLKYYVTDGSADSARFQVLDNKKKFLDQIRAKDGNVATDVTFDPSEISAACSGNPILQDKAELRSALKKAKSANDARQQDESRRAYRSAYQKERIGFLEKVIGDAPKVISACDQASDEIKNSRAKFEDDLNSTRSVIDAIRESHRENVRNEKDRIRAEFKADGKTEKEAREKIAVEQEGWDRILARKLSDAPKVPHGWITFNDKNGNPLKNLSVGDFGLYLIEMEGDMKRNSLRDNVAFSVGDIEVRMQRIHTELSGTITRLEASAISEDGSPSKIAWSRTLDATNSVSAGMMASGLINGLRLTADEMLKEYETAKAASSVKVEAEPWDRVKSMELIDFLKGTHDAAQNMLRCGLKDWDEGNIAYRIVSGAPVEGFDEKTERVRNMVTGPMAKLASEVIPLSIGYIRSWLKNKDVIKTAISSNKAIPDEVVRSASVMSCDPNWSMSEGDKVKSTETRNEP